MDEWDERGQGAGGAPSATSTVSTNASDDARSVERHVAVGDEERAEHEGFWPEFRKQVISWRTMKPQQRLITGAAVAQLLAAGLIIALHGVPAAQVYVGRESGHTAEMALPFFWASVIFMIVSLSFLMTGALRLSWPIRLLALAAMSWLTLFPVEPPEYSTFRLVMVALLWLWAALIAFAQMDPTAPGAKVWGPLRSLRARLIGLHRVRVLLATVIFMLVWQVILYVALLAATGWTRDPADYLFQLTIVTQLQSLIFVLVPFLFLAGSDFAELGELIAKGVARVTQAPRASRSAWLTLGLTFAVAVVIAVTSAPGAQHTLANYALAYGGELVMCGAVALILYALLRWGRAVTWESARGGSAMLLLVTLGYFAVTWIAIIAVLTLTSSPKPSTLADYTVYRSPATMPAFSLPRPTSWTYTEAQSGSEAVVTFSGAGQLLPGAFWVVVHQPTDSSGAAAAQDMTSFVTQGTPTGRVLEFGAAGNDGAWHTQRFTFSDPAGQAAPLVGEGWSQTQGGRDWALIGLSSGVYQSTLSPVFAEMTHSWRPDLNATVPVASTGYTDAEATRAAAIFEGLVPLVLGLALGFWLIRRGRAHHHVWQVAGVFVAALGLASGAAAIPAILTALGAPGKAFWYLQLNLSGLQQATALATLALVAFVALRQRADALWLALVRLALTLNIGLLFIALMYHLYAVAIGLSHRSSTSPLSWAEGLIVLIALGWDLLMSGEMFTNRDDRMPRSTRLLLYLGYITLTATLVMFFSALNYPAASDFHDSLFESEPWPQVGLLILGTPMVITTFALAMAEWVRHMRRRRRGVYDEAAPGASEGVVSAAVIAREDG